MKSPELVSEHSAASQSSEAESELEADKSLSSSLSSFGRGHKMFREFADTSKTIMNVARDRFRARSRSREAAKDNGKVTTLLGTLRTSVGRLWYSHKVYDPIKGIEQALYSVCTVPKSVVNFTRLLRDYLLLTIDDDLSNESGRLSDFLDSIESYEKAVKVVGLFGRNVQEILLAKLREADAITTRDLKLTKIIAASKTNSGLKIMILLSDMFAANGIQQIEAQEDGVLIWFSKLPRDCQKFTEWAISNTTRFTSNP